MRNNHINSAVIKSVSGTIAFFGIVLSVIVALLLYNKEENFISVLKNSLSPSVLIAAISVIATSSLLYTPLSFGVSNYLIKNRYKKQSFLEVFYLFKYPRLLFKAMLVNAFRRAALSGIRLVILAAALAIELLAVFVFKINIKTLAVISILLWLAVLISMFYFKIRYIMCKYCFICYPSEKTVDILKRGLRITKGKTLYFAKNYLKYISVYVVTFLTLGKFYKIKDRNDTFSSFAVDLVTKQKC